MKTISQTTTSDCSRSTAQGKLFHKLGTKSEQKDHNADKLLLNLMKLIIKMRFFQINITNLKQNINLFLYNYKMPIVDKMTIVEKMPIVDKMTILDKTRLITSMKNSLPTNQKQAVIRPIGSLCFIYYYHLFLAIIVNNGSCSTTGVVQFR